MKPINFINPLPPRRQKELDRWSKLSVTLTCTVFLICAFLLIRQLMVLRSLKEKQQVLHERTAPFENCLDCQRKLKTEKELLTQQIAHITDLTQTAHRLGSCLEAMYKTCNDDIIINSFTIDGHMFALTMQCPSQNKAYSTVQYIKEMQVLKKTKIVALQSSHETSALACTIKGSI